MPVCKGGKEAETSNALGGKTLLCDSGKVLGGTSGRGFLG